MKQQPPDFKGISDVVILWSNVAMGVVLALAVIFAIWKIVMICIAIVRNSDNPEARANYVSALKWPIIAVIAPLLLIAVMNIILQVIKSYSFTIGS